MRFLSDQATEKLFGKISPPPELNNVAVQKGGAKGISFLLSTFIGVIFTVAAITFLFMLSWGALQWIFSGGDKEAVGKARGRITYAIAGLIFLGLVFFLLRLIGIITNLNLFTLE